MVKITERILTPIIIAIKVLMVIGCILVVLTSQAQAVVYFEDDLESWSYTTPSDFVTNGWANASTRETCTDDYTPGTGTSWCAQKIDTGGNGGGGCAILGKGRFIDTPIPTPTSREVYVRFYSYVTSAGSGYGSKWLKIFGPTDGGCYTNYTFARQYASGVFQTVGGSDVTTDCTRDSEQTFNYPGGSFTPSTTNYEYYEYYLKFAGPPNYNDGVFRVWYQTDDNMIHEQTGLENADSQQGTGGITSISISNLTQDQEENIGWRYVDDVVVASEKIGELSAASGETEISATGTPTVISATGTPTIVAP